MKTHPVVRWIGLIAGVNLILRGVGLWLLPAVGIPLEMTNRRIWPFEFVGEEGTAAIWIIVGLVICASLASGERLRIGWRIFARVLGLWTYWNMMLNASIVTLASTGQSPWIWGAWTSNWIICIAYTIAMLKYKVAPQQRHETESPTVEERLEDPENHD